MTTINETIINYISPERAAATEAGGTSRAACGGVSYVWAGVGKGSRGETVSCATGLHGGTPGTPMRADAAASFNRLGLAKAWAVGAVVAPASAEMS